MKDLSRVKKNEKGYYVEYVHKIGKLKGYVYKCYGQIREHCLVCNEPYFATNSHIKEGYGQFCSFHCELKNKIGKNSQDWKGGRIKNSQEYIMKYNPKHPYCNCHRYVLEHRLIMEKYLGRYLKFEEVVHHINGIKDNNKIKNLKLFKNRGEHRKIHTNKGS